MSDAAPAQLTAHTDAAPAAPPLAPSPAAGVRARRGQKRAHSVASRASSPSPTASSPRSVESHVESCIACGGIGELLLCDACPLAFHLRCVGLRRVPEAFWQCPVCAGHATLSDYRMRRQAARERERQRDDAHDAPLTRGRRAAGVTAAAAADAEHTAAGVSSRAAAAEATACSRPTDDADEQAWCAFCREPPLARSSGMQASTLAGSADADQRMLGPYWEEDRRSARRVHALYVHRACALWSPRVFSERGRLQNVVLEVQRARWLRCSECRQRGASIGCNEPSCERTYHYQCAVRALCLLRMPAYSLFCPQHAMRENLHTLQLEPQLRAVRLANARQQVAQRDAPASAPPVRHLDSEAHFYSATALLEAHVQRHEQRRPKHAHLAHLPPAERRRVARMERTIRTVEQDEAERARDLAHQRKRQRATLSPTERQAEEERERAKLADDAHALADMNSAGAGGAPAESAWCGLGGLQSQIEALKEAVLLPLLYPELYAQRHITPPRGLLLLGPPGTGKTSLARALAHACTSVCGQRVRVYARKGADILSRYHGDAELTLRTLFACAARHAPSVLYFDELDGLCPPRSAKQAQVHASVVTTLLALMDGLDPLQHVFVLASTNRPDAIDPALRRPGRFDRELTLALPTHAQRDDILAVLTRHWPPASQLAAHTRHELASLTCGFSGADLQALLAQAALLASHRTLGPALLPPDSHSSLAPRRDAAVVAQLASVRVTAHDLHSSLSRVSSSVQRHDAALAQLAALALSPPMHALLDAKVGEAMDALDWTAVRDDADALAAPSVSAADDEAPGEQPALAQPTLLHRLLICDEGVSASTEEQTDALDAGGHAHAHPHASHLVLRALLARLEATSVRSLEVSQLQLDTEALTLEEALVRVFHAHTPPHSTTVYVLPRLDVWWQQAARRPALRAALVACLRGVSAAASGAAVAGQRRVFVATSTRPASALSGELHPWLREFLSPAHAVACRAVNAPALAAFFTRVLRDAAARLLDYAALLPHALPGAGPAELSAIPASATSTSPAVPSLRAALHADSSAVSAALSHAGRELAREHVRASLTYPAAERVELHAARWLHRQMEACRREARVPTAPALPDAHTTTLLAVLHRLQLADAAPHAADASASLAALLAHLRAGLTSCVASATAEGGASA